MVNYRRSPYETAYDIDLFEVATNEDTTKVFWQFLECDENPNIADIRRCFWQMFDERESPLMSTFYKKYLAQDADYPNHDPFYTTNARQPGRSQRISDKHVVDFKNFFSKNTKDDSPHRAIRAVMIHEIEDFDEFIGPGVKEIDDNNQYPTFQFRDNNGWKNFCPTHANELRMSVLKGEKSNNALLVQGFEHLEDHEVYDPNRP